MEYRVIGTIKLAEYHCDCPHCLGHNTDETRDVDYTFEAADKEHAKRLAKEDFEAEGGAFGKWLNVIVLGPDEKPPWKPEIELTLLERWNTGAGLTPDLVAQVIA
jgi:hypothetical protein